MRRISQINRSIDLLTPRTILRTHTQYLCPTCKHQTTTSFSTSAFRSKKVAFTEKVRRKIWGTDQPPGLEDPYGGMSKFDRTKEKEVAEEKADREERKLKSEVQLSEDYEPALSWEGLEEVGFDKVVYKRTFEGFARRGVLVDRLEIEAALHRALVEVLSLQKGGKSVKDISKGKLGVDNTQEVQIKVVGQDVDLVFPETVSMQDVIESLSAAPVEVGKPTESEEDVAADRSEEDPLAVEEEVYDETEEHENPTESEEDVAADRSELDPLKNGTSKFATHEELIASWDPSWLQVSLEKTDVKFAVLKRMLQLTGIRISDASIQPSKTIQALLRNFAKPPPPKTLFEALQEKDELLELPNVQVFGRRVTPIDKEKQVGRWKVIEQELRAKDLPITGRG